MKKNEIKFVSTETGINCEGTCVLSKEDRNKCEEMLQQVQNAAKDCGASLSITPTGIQLGFNVACSCEMDTIHEAAARMKCIIEEMREFISKLEPAKHENKPTTEFEIAVDAAFETLTKHFPDCGFCIVGVNPEDNRAAIVGNIDPNIAAVMLIHDVNAHEHD